MYDSGSFNSLTALHTPEYDMIQNLAVWGEEGRGEQKNMKITSSVGVIGFHLSRSDSKFIVGKRGEMLTSEFQLVNSIQLLG